MIVVNAKILRLRVVLRLDRLSGIYRSICTNLYAHFGINVKAEVCAHENQRGASEKMVDRSDHYAVLGNVHKLFFHQPIFFYL